MTKHNLSILERMITHGEEDKKTGCINWTGYRNPQGYGKVRFQNEAHLVSRVWWRLLRGKFPKELKVLHKCDNPACFNIKHLYLGTQKENIRDAIEKGRFEYNWGRPLEKVVVAQVEDLLKAGWSLTKIARTLNIGKTSVARIRDKTCHDT